MGKLLGECRWHLASSIGFGPQVASKFRQEMPRPPLGPQVRAAVTVGQLQTLPAKESFLRSGDPSVEISGQGSRIEVPGLPQILDVNAVYSDLVRCNLSARQPDQILRWRHLGKWVRSRGKYLEPQGC